MRALLSFAVLAIAAAAPAPAPARAADFDAVARSAERLDALEPFLVRYVGHCVDVYERRTCEANVAATRRSADGKTFAVRVQDAAPLVKPEVRGDGRFLLLLTPFVDGGGVALTHGAPLRQDAQGHPLVGLLPIPGTLPDGTMEMEFESPFRTGAIELEIVFRPEKPWKLKRKGEAGSYEGVAARFLAVRVLDARTGAPIATKVF
ncbi:DUF6066 family protein [Anaeromyxobacter dehalogenans]|uniref:Uncharacterized protein n=1 Tax=Anaeromyxobacter dehalogenans (strain 2CP-C) TaxID=290397 RepID=Q2IIR0_ANADE|nr:DUF6066 family protein [Anaeromyxobacter dehalogenans]ABC81543.1 hypothetical protein Adeh_1770 [Anaeromyxobacter dehalogenans 2CP-C]